MEALTKDVATLQKKGRVSGKRNAAALAGLLAKVRHCKATVARAVADGSGSSAASAAVSELQRAVKDAKYVQKAKAEHKSLHVALAKLGKNMDKHLKEGVGAFTRAPTPEERRAVVEAVCDHLYRNGRFDVADAIMQRQSAKYGYASVALQKTPFEHMVPILDDFRRGDYSSALAWAGHNSRQLRLVGSDIEFELHKLRFMQILATPRSGRAAIGYGQQHFPLFSTRHMADIRRLMGAVLYAGRLAASPYADLASVEQAARVERMLVEDNCLLKRLPPQSALDLSVRAGFLSLPVLHKLQTVMRATGTDSMPMSALPVEIDLPDYMHFHSSFACPVSRELVADGNPPMLLACGHVISKEALDNITAARSRFKCPTCRVDQTAAHVLQLHL